jgi:hypothetical protein
MVSASSKHATYAALSSGMRSPPKRAAAWSYSVAASRSDAPGIIFWQMNKKSSRRKLLRCCVSFNFKIFSHLRSRSSYHTATPHSPPYPSDCHAQALCAHAPYKSHRATSGIGSSSHSLGWVTLSVCMQRADDVVRSSCWLLGRVGWMCVCVCVCVCACSLGVERRRHLFCQQTAREKLHSGIGGHVVTRVLSKAQTEVLDLLLSCRGVQHAHLPTPPHAQRHSTSADATASRVAGRLPNPKPLFACMARLRVET